MTYKAMTQEEMKKSQELTIVKVGKTIRIMKGGKYVMMSIFRDGCGKLMAGTKEKGIPQEMIDEAMVQAKKLKS